MSAWTPQQAGTPFPTRFSPNDRVRIQSSGLVGTVYQYLKPSVAAIEQPYTVSLDRGGFTMALDSEIEFVPECPECCGAGMILSLAAENVSDCPDCHGTGAAA